MIQQLQPSNVVFQNFDSATKVSFRISGRVHARAGIQGIQKRIWIHASRVRSGHSVLERLKKGQVNSRVSLALGDKAAARGVYSPVRKAFGAMKARCKNDRSLLLLDPRDSLGRRGKGPLPMAGRCDGSRTCRRGFNADAFVERKDVSYALTDRNAKL